MRVFSDFACGKRTKLRMGFFGVLLWIYSNLIFMVVFCGKFLDCRSKQKREKVGEILIFKGYRREED
jgi:hypothetical protein